MSFSVSLAMRRNCSWEGLEARHGCAPSRRILRTLAASLGWLMAADDIERLRRIYDAFDRRAVDDLLADLAHDMEWRAPTTPSRGAPPPPAQRAPARCPMPR